MPNPFLLFWSEGDQAEIPKKSNRRKIKIPNEGAFGSGFWGGVSFLA